MPATRPAKSKTTPTPAPAVRKNKTAQSRKKGQTPIEETVEPDPSQPAAATTQPPKKRGRKPKAATSDAETEAPPKKVKSSTVKTLPPTRRTSKQVAAEREVIRKAAEEEAERGEAAKRLLAEMQIDEELSDEDMEIDNPHHLAVVGGRSRAESGDDGGESFESISSGPDSDFDEDDGPKLFPNLVEGQDSGKARQRKEGNCPG